MAKKQQKAPESDAEQRQSRKDALRAQKQDRQMRSLRIAGAIILGVIALIVAIALVNELLISPGRVVATVGDTSITLREWQDRVRFERAQRIIFLENQLEAFGGDVGIVQQFGGNIINELFDHETLGQDVLNTMADEAVICQALEDRGIEITDGEVEAEIGRLYNFYGEGVSPTRPPDPTETVQPTPSLTPIPTAVITDVVPTLTPFPTATAGPTSTPVPSPTPVSLQAFEDQYNEFVGSLTEMNVDESIYRQAIRAQLCRERLTDALTAEEDLSRSAPQASLFVITANSEEAANEAMGLAESEGFLTAWNMIRSSPPDPEATEEPATSAFELLWRTRTSLEASVGEEVAEAAFELPLDEPSELIAVVGNDDATTYYVIMVSGREEREMSESEFNTRQQELLQGFIDNALTGNLQINDFWRSRVPTSPALDSKFLTPPTPTPVVEQVLPTAAPAESEDGE